MTQKVVIVDDNASSLELEMFLFEVKNFQIFGAENARDGIALAIAEIPDVIVMDVRLPDLSGIEAAKILRQHPDTKDIPIVFVTASIMAEGRALIDNIPNSGFISKPINTRTFVDDVLKYIRAK